MHNEGCTPVPRTAAGVSSPSSLRFTAVNCTCSRLSRDGAVWGVALLDTVKENLKRHSLLMQQERDKVLLEASDGAYNVQEHPLNCEWLLWVQHCMRDVW